MPAPKSLKFRRRILPPIFVGWGDRIPVRGFSNLGSPILRSEMSSTSRAGVVGQPEAMAETKKDKGSASESKSSAFRSKRYLQERKSGSTKRSAEAEASLTCDDLRGIYAASKTGCCRYAQKIQDELKSLNKLLQGVEANTKELLEKLRDQN